MLISILWLAGKVMLAYSKMSGQYHIERSLPQKQYLNLWNIMSVTKNFEIFVAVYVVIYLYVS